MAIVLDGTNGVTTNSGTLISATTIGVGGATPAASGAGITFPATASPSSDANTLDDYEEGTWTATLTGGTTAPTTPITSLTAKYIKIGRLVTVSFNFDNANTTGASGGLIVTGLPFASDVSIAQSGCPPLLYNLPATGNYTVWYITGTTLNLYAINNASPFTLENISAGTTKYIWSTVTYTTA